MTTTTTTIKQ